MRVSISAPCTLRQFLCGVGSILPGASKECSLCVWSDVEGKPGLLLYSEPITISAVDSGKIYWHSYDLSVPIMGAFWIGVYEFNTYFPTVVFDEVGIGSYSSDGVRWSIVSGDYFYGILLDDGAAPDIYVFPDSLFLSIDEGEIGTCVFSVYNVSFGPDLVVDSIKWDAPWIQEISPSTFDLPVGDVKNVLVVVQGCGIGDHLDTIKIFSTDPVDSIETVIVALNVF